MTFNWDPVQTGTNQLDNLSAGLYQVTVLDEETGCQLEELFMIETNGGPVIENLVVEHGSCDDPLGSISFDVTGDNLEITWDPNVSTSTSAMDLEAGTYVIMVVDTLTQCMTIEEIDIQSHAGLDVALSTDSTSCGNTTGSIVVSILMGTAPYTVAWTGPQSDNQSGIGGPQFSIDNLPFGDYTINVEDDAGCTYAGTILLEGMDGLTIDNIQVSNTSCVVDTGMISFDINGGVGILQYNWDPNVSTTNIAENLEPGTYQVTVTDTVSGCSLDHTFRSRT